MPRGHDHDPMYSLSIYARFSGQVFCKFSWKKIVIGKKDRCAVFGCKNKGLFPRNIQWSSPLARKARVNTERVPPGHPIILLKSSKFDVAAVSVKRSIYKGSVSFLTLLYLMYCYFHHLPRSIQQQGYQLLVSSNGSRSYKREAFYITIFFVLTKCSRGGSMLTLLSSFFYELHPLDEEEGHLTIR